MIESRTLINDHAIPISMESGLMQNFALQRKKSVELRTEPLASRKLRLKNLREWILSNRVSIQEALFADFKKHHTEVDAIEIFPLLLEIKKALANLDSWASPKKVATPMTMLGTRSYILYEPRGVCLIIAPWNYPFLLCVNPLVSALAAGNTAFLKPSELTPFTSTIIGRMTREVFEPSIVSCYEGGAEMSQVLMQLPFDHIFFTGSPAVGKVVMKAAAEHLTSVTLELGGKSPAIVARDAHLTDAAERVAVSKFVNNGQTCIAPDYVLVHESIAEEYVQKLLEKTEQIFKGRNDTYEQSSSYCRIVNNHHFQRLDKIIKETIDEGARVRLGGVSDNSTRFIQPTVLTEVSLRSRVMHEEIFGPILPVLTFSTLEQAIQIVNEMPKPLALSIFSQSKAVQKRVIGETASGGACINDCGMQFFQHNLPFGGVNNSGLGKSHGYYGFLDFSNQKSVLKQKKGRTIFKMLYPPYTARSRKIMNWLFGFLRRF